MLNTASFSSPIPEHSLVWYLLEGRASEKLHLHIQGLTIYFAATSFIIKSEETENCFDPHWKHNCMTLSNSIQHFLDSLSHLHNLWFVNDCQMLVCGSVASESPRNLCNADLQFLHLLWISGQLGLRICGLSFSLSLSPGDGDTQQGLGHIGINKLHVSLGSEAKERALGSAL